MTHQVPNAATVLKPQPVSLKTSIAKVDPKSVGVSAEGLFYNKV